MSAALHTRREMFSCPRFGATQYHGLEPPNPGLLGAYSSKGANMARMTPEVFSQEGNICSLSLGRLQLAAMGLLGSEPVFKQAWSRGRPVPGYLPWEGFRICQQRLPPSLPPPGTNPPLPTAQFKPLPASLLPPPKTLSLTDAAGAPGSTVIPPVKGAED